jgi:3-oxoacyl-[acyl-carrier protein] reductase
MTDKTRFKNRIALITGAGSETGIGFAATPAEVGDLIAFLASDESTYISGQLFVIAGGNTIQDYKGPSKLYY